MGDTSLITVAVDSIGGEYAERLYGAALVHRAPQLADGLRTPVGTWVSETTTSREQSVPAGAKPSSIDLARVALHAAREAAKKRGAPRRSQGRIARRDG